MTARELIQTTDRHPWLLAGMFVFAPLAAWLCGQLHGRSDGANPPWKYCYSILVYLTCVPGVFAGVLTAYALFFTNENLLDVSFLVALLKWGAYMLFRGRDEPRQERPKFPGI